MLTQNSFCDKLDLTIKPESQRKSLGSPIMRVSKLDSPSTGKKWQSVELCANKVERNLKARFNMSSRAYRHSEYKQKQARKCILENISERLSQKRTQNTFQVPMQRIVTYSSLHK